MLVLVMLITCLPMTQKQEARAAGNPYGKWQDVNRNGRQEVRCTWFAWQRAYDLTGVALPGWRNAGGWLNRARNAGYATGTTARAKSIAVWRRDNTTNEWGHVAYVSSVSGGVMYIDEGGRTDLEYTPSQGIAYGRRVGAVVGNPDYSGSQNHLVGFIYLGGSAPAPQPAAGNPSVKAVWADKYDTNMVAKSRIYNPNRSRITTVGIQVRDGNNIIGRKEEMMNSNYQYKEQTNFWFDFNAELGLRLRPGHVYGWQMYADIGGKRCYTDWINDRTTGTEKPNTPAFSTAKTHYAVGDAVTVSWGADSCATGGYSLTITQTKGGSYSKTLTTNSANATSLAFSLPSEGEYKITGFAEGATKRGTLDHVVDDCQLLVVFLAEIGACGVYQVEETAHHLDHSVEVSGAHLAFHDLV